MPPVRHRYRRLGAPLALLLIACLAHVLGTAAPASAATVGSITGFSQAGDTFTITAGPAKVRVDFARADIFRLWLAPDGTFTDPVGSKLATKTEFGAVNPTYADAGDHYRISTNSLTLRAYKSPLRFALYKADNATLIWSETSGLTWDASSVTQSLSRGADEQFYGTGLRLGQWALRGMSVPVKVDNQWKENTNASPAPFYMSTNGYAVMRNTWKPGQYNFHSPVTTRHDESRYDAYFFVGDTPKNLLGDYTDVTGKPFLAPIWGLELGNADCWSTYNTDPEQGPQNRPGHLKTPDVLDYARDARAKDMPSGWFLPNDGYGCEYEELPSTVSELKKLGFQSGLWTERSLSNIGWEVGTAGSRAVKTDVAWVGGGYEPAFDGVQAAVNGIENNSDARRFVWTVDGWAGTHRNAVVWTGDTFGTWNDMRWHVPAIAGAAFSGFNYATGDVDGIYGGSGPTYVRDLQWKAFTPAFMTMSGWGATNPSAGYQDKQPWRFGEPYLSINRKYLKLKMRLTPYFYTHSANASQSGVPTVRPMALEFPGDAVSRGNLTSQQFMAGDAFLVAPVTSDTSTRDDIYLPAGTWTDYWTGKTWTGPGWIDDYKAPLDTLPLLVKAGSIVPMWPQMNHSGEKPHTPITFDIHPRGSSSFTLYEDDGVTRAHRTGAFARQKVDVTAPAQGTGDITVNVGASQGSYTGKAASRGYQLDLRVSSAPTTVKLDGTTLTAHATEAAFDAATTGWFFDPATRGGTLHIKTGTKSTSAAFTVVASGATLPNGTAPTGDAPGTGTPTGTVKGVGSGRCVDIPGANTTTGTQLVIWDCHGGPNQTWQLSSDGTVRALGVCMTAATLTDLAPVTLSPCTAAPTQQWTYEATAQRLRNPASGKCLDVNAGASANGSKLILYTCHTGTNQQWTVPS
ncbi:glycosyl hydrolase family 31 [Streptomyces davaonensis JCM 4913]|uniref:Glycosyl hydrolase family 31 n=1 Tax=Streptomyces davaonensis (strain DSM 101723 / JCM 4913 / KCC S-0913 / 768) TaxID=1214101 RepID=K4R1D7_STRDJ|nr:ricin-type beta-trefoil lectin domain protein [Streptomyces davaonensis]CCK26942.1 glycosyl hydrolase family 31 [Streptomyces davaonensis JCM 4913]